MIIRGLGKKPIKLKLSKEIRLALILTCAFELFAQLIGTQITVLGAVA